MGSHHRQRVGQLVRLEMRPSPDPGRSPSISESMTVREWRVAQAATSKPVKGMLTGPVTIVNWSFRPPGCPTTGSWGRGPTHCPRGGYLEQAGGPVVQIDEPAVREQVAAPHGRRREAIGGGEGVRRWQGCSPDRPGPTHTHMCYGDFADIVRSGATPGVDVASVEFSRSKDERYIRLFYSLFDDGHLAIGPGVFDVHSP